MVPTGGVSVQKPGAANGFCISWFSPDLCRYRLYAKNLSPQESFWPMQSQAPIARKAAVQKFGYKAPFKIR